MRMWWKQIQAPDPEIVEAVANIPGAPMAWAGVEMQESRLPPGFRTRGGEGRV